MKTPYDPPNCDIDIVLATYNGEKYLKEQLESIRNQTYKQFSLIVRDDGSQDKTFFILKEELKNFTKEPTLIMRKEGNKGIIHNFEELIKLSTAEYTMLADQDDVWLPEKVEKAYVKIREIERMHSKQVPILVFTDLKVVDAALNVISDSFWRFQRLDPSIVANWRNLAVQNVVTGCTVIMNRSARNVCIPFPKADLLHDHWISACVSKNGIIESLDCTHILYRQHTSNAEAARRVTPLYLIKKISSLNKSALKAKAISKALGHEMGLLEIILRKAKLSIRRALTA